MTVLFNADNYRDFDAYQKELLNSGDYDTIEELPDDIVYSIMNDDENEDWEEAKNELRRICGNSRIIAIGSMGLWNGTFAGGFIADDIDTAISNCLGRDCEPEKIYVEDGNLVFEVVHHDGYNSWVLRQLTYDGYELYYQWENYGSDDEDLGEKSERDIHQILFNNPAYSLPIMI